MNDLNGKTGKTVEDNDFSCPGLYDIAMCNMSYCKFSECELYNDLIEYEQYPVTEDEEYF